jgi:hypothetical protein
VTEPQRCFRRTSERLPERNRTLYLLNGLARFNELSRKRGSNYARNSLETLLRVHLTGRDFSAARTAWLARTRQQLQGVVSKLANEYFALDAVPEHVILKT